MKKMKADNQNIKQLLLEVAPDDHFLNSVYFDQFLNDCSEDIKYKILEMWDAYLIEAKKQDPNSYRSPVSLN